MFAFILSNLTKESEKTTNVADKNSCFYSVLIPELLFLSQRNNSEIRNLLMVNFGEDMCNCILSMSLLSPVCITNENYCLGQ